MINHPIKGLYKRTCNKKVQLFTVFLFSLTAVKVFFSFLIKAFANFEKLIRFHWQAFIVYKNRENLKMLIQVFCQKLIVSNVILAFFLKPKFSSSANHGGRHRAPPLFKIYGSAPAYPKLMTRIELLTHWNILIPTIVVILISFNFVLPTV